MDNNKSRSRLSAPLFIEKIISLILQKDKKQNKSIPDQTKGQNLQTLEMYSQSPIFSLVKL